MAALGALSRYQGLIAPRSPISLPENGGQISFTQEPTMPPINPNLPRNLAFLDQAQRLGTFISVNAQNAQEAAAGLQRAEALRSRLFAELQLKRLNPVAHAARIATLEGLVGSDGQGGQMRQIMDDLRQRESVFQGNVEQALAAQQQAMHSHALTSQGSGGGDGAGAGLAALAGLAGLAGLAALGAGKDDDKPQPSPSTKAGEIYNINEETHAKNKLALELAKLDEAKQSRESDANLKLALAGIKAQDRERDRYYEERRRAEEKLERQRAEALAKREEQRLAKASNRSGTPSAEESCAIDPFPEKCLKEKKRLAANKPKPRTIRQRKRLLRSIAPASVRNLYFPTSMSASN